MRQDFGITAGLKQGLILALCSVLIPALTGAARGDDWPQLRGPRQSGTAIDNGVLDRGQFRLDLAWKRPLGSGYSSISVAGGRGVTMFADGRHDYVTAFDVATGRELWRYRIAEMYAGHSGSDDGPISTPTIHQGVVYGLGPRGHLFTVRLDDGGGIWSRTLDGEKDSRAPHYGFATAPVVVYDLVIVQTGGPDGHSITAFDIASGEPRWSAEDDPVNYQSPAVMDLGGRRQVVAINDKNLLGIDPGSGEILWRHEHGTEANEAFAQPVALGPARVLVNSPREVVAFRITPHDGSYEVGELWRSNAFQRSYAVPVLHENHLYGFSSRFLTCVDADTGEVVWKSRPPGGQGLILVDGKLLILSPKGELVVADASPRGYVEEARLAVFEREGMTAPSFAGGQIFVRNLAELASIRVTDAPPAAVATREERELLGEFGAFVRRVEASSDKAALVEEYLGAQQSLPIIESDGLVHFVYQGEVDDIGLSGNFLEFRDEVPMDRIAGTDVYFKSVKLDPEAVWEYRFNVDYGKLTTDPENPHTIASLFGPTSELRMPGFEMPDYLAEPAGERGRVDSFQFRSDVRGNERRIRLYLPPGYEQSDARYPLLVVNFGNWALEAGQIDRVLDNLIGKRIEPVIVALVQRKPGDLRAPRMADYVRMLTEELIPHIDHHYRTLAEPATRGIMGPAEAGAAVIYAVFKAPGFFGKVAAQSIVLQPPLSEDLFSLIEQSEARPLVAHIEWRRHDLLFERLKIDAAGDSQRVLRALEAKGYDVRSREVAGAWGWSSLRAGYGEILEALYPLPAGDP